MVEQQKMKLIQTEDVYEDGSEIRVRPKYQPLRNKLLNHPLADDNRIAPITALKIEFHFRVSKTSTRARSRCKRNR